MEKNLFQPVTFIGVILFLLIKRDAQIMADCTANTDVNVTFCGSSATLAGSAGGNIGAFSPTWIL